MSSLLQQALMMASASAPASTTKALLHFEGTNGSTVFTDESGKVWTAFGSAQVSTDQAQFGSSSGKFNGSTDYIQTPSVSDWNWGGADFTLEAWVYLTASPGSPYGAVVFGNSNPGGTDGWVLRVTPGATGLAFVHPGTAAYTKSGALSLNAWHHVCACRSGGSDIYVGVDGTVALAGNDGTTSWPDMPLRIGADNATSGPGYLEGYVDEARVTKGVALYTSNYIVPTSPFSYP